MWPQKQWHPLAGRELWFTSDGSYWWTRQEAREHQRGIREDEKMELRLRDCVLDTMRSDPHTEWVPATLSPLVGASEGMVLRTLNYLIEDGLVGSHENATETMYWPKSTDPVTDVILSKMNEAQHEQATTTRPGAVQAGEDRGSCHACGRAL